MGSLAGSPPKPPAPPPPPPVERDVSGAASKAMEDERARSTFLTSFLADRKKNKLGTGPAAGPSFLGNNS